MGRSYFIFKGRDCREMGIWLTGPLPIIRPEERVEHVQIPGRAGDLTRTEGEDIYNSYIHTAEIHVPQGIHVRNVYDWLRGEGWLTSSSEPDRRQMARVIGAITLDKVSKNLDIWRGTAQFYCQPLKQLLWEEKVTISAAGTVTNNGDVPAKPLYKITAGSTGTVVLTVSRTVGSSTSSETITITGVGSGSVVYVDSELMEVLNYTGAVSLAPYASGDFPLLRPGDNSISGSGWASIEITKRERYL